MKASPLWQGPQGPPRALPHAKCVSDQSMERDVISEKLAAGKVTSWRAAWFASSTLSARVEGDEVVLRQGDQGHEGGPAVQFLAQFLPANPGFST